MLQKTSEFADIQLSPLDCSSFPEAPDRRSAKDGVRLGRDGRRPSTAADIETRQLTIRSLVGPAFRFLVSFAAMFIVLYCEVPVVHRMANSSYAAIGGHVASLLGDAHETSSHAK